MWAKLKKHWFLFCLAVSFSIGYLSAESLGPLLELTWLRSGIVFGVMWLTGITLKADAMRRSIHDPLPTLLAITINIAIVPLLALPAKTFLPPAMFGGLFVASLVPCTLASAAVWTRKAGGNDSIALMTTVVTNLACLIVLPMGLSVILSQQMELSATDQIHKLAIIVVAPLVLAQAMRRAGWSEWADHNKLRLSTLAQCGILSMVFFGAIASSQLVRDAGIAGSQITWLTLAAIIVAAVGIHLGALLLGIVFAKAIGTTRENQIAVGFSGSQKTLMVGLQIAIDCGVSVIPMLVYHLGQLTLDTLIADRWHDEHPRE